MQREIMLRRQGGGELFLVILAYWNEKQGKEYFTISSILGHTNHNQHFDLKKKKKIQNIKTSDVSELGKDLKKRKRKT